ncbi:PTS system N-acetylgalactosamine-specific IID component [Melghirimyces profundicolus]|uniref:PTS system N-acetylgalactosamine-specific IID component n=1 Tax=Melghirimyces profundicolus TaxID=1242148 RepID=A0A2T6BD68_9BACL|nr:PTS system mannose/fructose/sorbose family transporter subunit IID [Melghirimyces profundicolus]PTX53996.1 PTS system N-acetylgalactosamine-specific IID component [Melghirimyces profundicolus]
MAFEEQTNTRTANADQPEKRLSRTDLMRMAVRSFFLQSSFNYERMQAGGWLYSLMPALKKIYRKREELSDAMKRHLDFFNTHPFLVTPILGIVAAMEESREKPDAIRGIKVGMMGPLGGVGDAVAWLTLLPITAGIGASIAMEGSLAGPIVFLLTFNAIHLMLRFGGIFYGYNTGVKALQKLKSGTQAISRAASIVGLTVVGGMIASYVKLSTPAKIPIGKESFEIQKELLDKVMPNLLPLTYTLLIFFLLKKGYSPLKLIGITVLIGVAGKYFGVL